jgi:peptide-methionine (R)-S-oxide reductase
MQPHAMDDLMNRRHFLSRTLVAAAGVAALRQPMLADAQGPAATGAKIDKVVKTEDEWRKLLTPEQFAVLRKEGTERPWTSALNAEKRAGTFICAACHQPLFASRTKYDSGTGWPSFFQPLPGALATRRDWKMILPRTEYHCARCGGHQGHVFDDGPQPTGQRYCNNGVALKFVPEGEALPPLVE